MKKLIVVCEEKYRAYGDYLAQLISMEDDTEDTIVGTKDGEVVAQVWSEKEYTANAATLASSQYILFIGENKLIKDKSANMDIKFSEFGMQYGWLGKQGFLTVREPIKKRSTYDDFIKFAQKYQKRIDNLINDSNKKGKLMSNELLNGMGIGIIPGLIVGGPVGMLAGAVAGGVATAFGKNPAKVLSGVNEAIKLAKESKPQMYGCAVLKLYIDDLSEFLGL